MTQDNIISYLRAKYNPKAILLHGSRARGDAVETSDYDLVLITEKPEIVRPEYYEGYALDVGGISPIEEILRSAYVPLWPCQVLFDDSGHLGNQLAKRTEATFMQGPPPLTHEEIENRCNFSRRLITRIQGRGADPLVRFYYMGDFYQRILRYWCELRQKWPLSVHPLLLLIAAEDALFYQLLQGLWSENYQEVVKKIHQHLFKEIL
jgi:hypothetical protein